MSELLQLQPDTSEPKHRPDGTLPAEFESNHKSQDKPSAESKVQYDCDAKNEQKEKCLAADTSKVELSSASDAQTQSVAVVGDRPTSSATHVDGARVMLNEDNTTAHSPAVESRFESDNVTKTEIPLVSTFSETDEKAAGETSSQGDPHDPNDKKVDAGASLMPETNSVSGCEKINALTCTDPPYFAPGGTSGLLSNDVACQDRNTIEPPTAHDSVHAERQASFAENVYNLGIGTRSDQATFSGAPFPESDIIRAAMCAVDIETMHTPQGLTVPSLSDVMTVPVHPSSNEATMAVRKSLLDAIVQHQAKRISELERRLRKKRAKIEMLANSHLYIPGGLHALGIMQTPDMTASQSAIIAAAAAQMQQQQLQVITQTNPFLNATDPQLHAAVAASAGHVLGMPASAQHPAHSNSQDTDRKQSRYWTAEEHQRFLQAVKQCGPKNYVQIAEIVGTRNAKQVRTHAQKFQKKLEREDAKRRASGNPSSHAATIAAAAAVAGMHPPGLPSAAAVAAAAHAAAMSGFVDSSSSESGKSEFGQDIHCSQGSSRSTSSSSDIEPSPITGNVTAGTLDLPLSADLGVGASSPNPTAAAAAAVAAIAAEAVSLGRRAASNVSKLPADLAGLQFVGLAEPEVHSGLPSLDMNALLLNSGQPQLLSQPSDNVVVPGSEVAGKQCSQSPAPLGSISRKSSKAQVASASCGEDSSACDALRGSGTNAALHDGFLPSPKERSDSGKAEAADDSESRAQVLTNKRAATRTHLEALDKRPRIETTSENGGDGVEAIPTPREGTETEGRRPGNGSETVGPGGSKHDGSV